MSVASSAIAAAIMIFSGKGIISLFVKTGEPGVIKQGAEYLMIVSAFYVLAAVMFITSGMLRGAGDMIPSSLSSLVSLIVRVVAAFVLSIYTPLGYLGIWWSVPIGWLFGMIVAIWRYRQDAWKQKAVVGSIG